MSNHFPQLPRLVRGAALTCLLAASAPPASGDIVGSFVVNGNGTVTYFYEVDNTAGFFEVSLWSLDFAFANPDWNQLDAFSGGDVAVPNVDWFAQAGIPIGGSPPRTSSPSTLPPTWQWARFWEASPSRAPIHRGWYRIMSSPRWVTLPPAPRSGRSPSCRRVGVGWPDSPLPGP